MGTKMSLCSSGDDIIIDSTKKICSNNYPLPGIIAGQPISIFKKQNDHRKEDKISIFMNPGIINNNENEEAITLTKNNKRQNNNETTINNTKASLSRDGGNHLNSQNRIIECIVIPDERNTIIIGYKYPERQK